MRKKFYNLALWSFLTALAIYAFSYFFYHYFGPNGFGTVFYETPTKPFVSLLLGIWGVTFHFASVMCLFIGKIFFGKE